MPVPSSTSTTRLPDEYPAVPRASAPHPLAAHLPVLHWRKSSASIPNGNCVEVAELPGGTVAVRNSRDPDGPALLYPRAQMAAFLLALKNGEFDALIGLYVAPAR